MEFGTYLCISCLYSSNSVSPFSTISPLYASESIDEQKKECEGLIEKIYSKTEHPDAWKLAADTLQAAVFDYLPREVESSLKKLKKISIKEEIVDDTRSIYSPKKSNLLYTIKNVDELVQKIIRAV